MKLLEIIYAIKKRLNTQSDDTKYSDRYLGFLINSKRAVFLRQELNQMKRNIDSSVLQTICLPTEVTSSSECNCPIPSGCIVLRTKDPLPKVFDNHFKTMITRVSGVQRLDKPFTIVSKSRAQYASFNIFNNTVNTYLDTDNRLYFVGKQKTINLIESVSITGVFENPYELETIPSCSGSGTCFSLDIEYPLGSHMIDPIINTLVQELANSMQLGTDVTNDGSDHQTEK